MAISAYDCALTALTKRTRTDEITMLLNLLLMILSVTGHLGICVIAYNQAQATGLPRWIRKGSEKVIFAFGILFPIWILFVLFRGSHGFDSPLKFYQNDSFVFGYAGACWAISVYVTIVFVIRKLKQAKLSCLTAHSIEIVDVGGQSENPLAVGRLMRTLAGFPGNQIFKLAVEEKRIRLRDLPSGLDGLSITHLSDFHLTGKTDIAYFEYVIGRAEEFQSDLVFVTGDIIDSKDCWEWIDKLFTKLQAPLGVYFVLGNHDRRVKPVDETIDRFCNAGATMVSGRWVTLEKDGETIHLCGNDLPWFKYANKLPENPETQSERGIRILLSHSPDQIYWSRKYKIDLVLAGHTHGGQIRIPYYGSIVSASKYGNAFSAGVFEEDGKVMHVSRGLSGTQPLRINCLPEITKLILECNTSE